MTKYIFVTGGVVSSLGKGIVAASLGRLLRARGYSVTVQKFDPYINVDPGTMSPFQHGEVFVTDDGAETDLDLGHYERFIDTNLGKVNNVTAGSVYLSVITKERKGEYLGGTVQTIPHITDEIKGRIKKASEAKTDFLIAEVGGTIGDIEGLPFIEAIRQFKVEAGLGNSVFIHVTLLPYINAAGELKTKPSQHSVMTLRSVGIQPDILVCRTQRAIPKTEKDKLALFCNVATDAVIECRDKKSIYEVPSALEEKGIATQVLKILGMEDKEPDLKEWEAMVERVKNPSHNLKIAIAGKYTKLSDAYISVVESIKHACAAFDSNVEIKWLAAEECTDMQAAEEMLGDVDGVIVPGGFGVRGIEGKVNVIQYARENNIPFLGLCLGMQCAVIDFARNVVGLKDANSSEFDEKTPFPVIDFMAEQEDIIEHGEYGGTMRLGQYECHLKPETNAISAYGSDVIYERHRHRYEFNNKYRKQIEDAGLVISGLYKEKNLVEIVEYPKNSWHVASQFHPEFKSRPDKPHPLFMGMVKAAFDRHKTKTQKDNLAVR